MCVSKHIKKLIFPAGEASAAMAVEESGSEIVEVILLNAFCCCGNYCLTRAINYVSDYPPGSNVTAGDMPRSHEQWGRLELERSNDRWPF